MTFPFLYLVKILKLWTRRQKKKDRGSLYINKDPSLLYRYMQHVAPNHLDLVSQIVKLMRKKNKPSSVPQILKSFNVFFFWMQNNTQWKPIFNKTSISTKRQTTEWIFIFLTWNLERSNFSHTSKLSRKVIWHIVSETNGKAISRKRSTSCSTFFHARSVSGGFARMGFFCYTRTTIKTKPNLWFTTYLGMAKLEIFFITFLAMDSKISLAVSFFF